MFSSLMLASLLFIPAVVFAQQTGSPEPQPDPPDTSFIERKTENLTEADTIAVDWSIDPVMEIPGVFRITISAPEEWTKAYLLVNGNPVTMITPNLLQSQNSQRREDLEHVETNSDKKVELDALRNSIPLGQEKGCFLWNFGPTGKPANVKILIQTSDGKVGIGN